MRQHGGSRLPGPRSWREAYAIIIGWLLASLGIIFLLDWLKGVL